MSADIETIVVGAGVVGLAVGRSLAEAGQEVVVLERHDRIGAEISSRNSEVVHAGLYYPPGSLRARLGVQGNRDLYRFSAENGVAVNRCGKLLVAADAAEAGRLQAIMENARLSGVDDLVAMSGEEARELEPGIACEAACLSPSTGVVDSHALMVALEGHLAARSGQVVLGTRVNAVVRRPDGYFALETESAGERAAVSAKRLVIAAGLGATQSGDMVHAAGGYRPPRTYPAKGHYYQLAGRSPFRRLIYPMPQEAWLGLHLTFDIAGRVKFGPDIEWESEVDYAFDDPDGTRKAAFERAVRRYWPGLPEDALLPDTTGIRPKIYRQGEPVADFAIHGEAEHGLCGLVGLYGIESPGLTSALAIGAHVAGLLSRG